MDIQTIREQLSRVPSPYMHGMAIRHCAANAPDETIAAIATEIKEDIRRMPLYMKQLLGEEIYFHFLDTKQTCAL